MSSLHEISYHTSCCLVLWSFYFVLTLIPQKINFLLKYILFIDRLELWKLQSAVAQDQVLWNEIIPGEYLHQSCCKAKENMKSKLQYKSFCELVISHY